jgi:hypothetical protein
MELRTSSSTVIFTVCSLWSPASHGRLPLRLQLLVDQLCSPLRSSPRPGIQLAAVRDHRFPAAVCRWPAALYLAASATWTLGADAVCAALVLGGRPRIPPGRCRPLAIIILPGAARRPVRGRRGSQWLRSPHPLVYNHREGEWDPSSRPWSAIAGALISATIPVLTTPGQRASGRLCSSSPGGASYTYAVTTQSRRSRARSD